MLEAHLVQELEIKEAGNRGRPAVGLVVETEAWHYLSLRISRGEIFLALRDLSSKLVVEESQELALKMTRHCWSVSFPISISFYPPPEKT